MFNVVVNPRSTQLARCYTGETVWVELTANAEGELTGDGARQ